MPKEKFPSHGNELGAVENLSAYTKVRYLLESFDLGRGTKEEKEERKKNFLNLLGDYYYALKKSRVNSENLIADSAQHRSDIHNKIMDIIRNISLSREITPDQRKISELLASNRELVEVMIDSYFSHYNTGNPSHNSELHQALRGDGLFSSPPGKEND